jgi:hypothetical protein
MIDWLAFISVAVASLVSASVVVSLFAFGLRLLNVGGNLDAEETVETTETSATGTVNVVQTVVSAPRPAWATWCAYACFVLCAGAILYGIYLIIPFFHR